jgi:FdhE protein
MSTPENRVNRITKAFTKLREELPQLKDIFDSFQPLLEARTLFKSKIDINFDHPEIDPQRFNEGVPILTERDFVIGREQLKTAAGEMIPAMKHGFPQLTEGLEIVESAIAEDRIDPELVLPTEAADELLNLTGNNLGVPAPVLLFVLTQLFEPFVKAKAEAISIPDNLQWSKGYCPICGSWPELSVVREKEGKRVLRCSFCAHEWNFMRLKCPFCETDDQDKLELLFSDDRKFERAELCRQCNTYLLSYDTRDLVEELPAEVALIGMIYLDILAQEKGFKSGKLLAEI